VKILNVQTPINCEVVATNEREYPTYRRFGPHNWECLMFDDSWRRVFYPDLLEQAYQEFIASRARTASPNLD